MLLCNGLLLLLLLLSLYCYIIIIIILQSDKQRGENNKVLKVFYRNNQLMLRYKLLQQINDIIARQQV